MKKCNFLTFKANEAHLNLNGMTRNFIFPFFTSNYTTKKKSMKSERLRGRRCTLIYIQSWPKRLTHYDFWKIIAFGSKNEFKMGDQCYHELEEVPPNISRGVPNHWPNSAVWSIHIISIQCRGVKIPLLNFVCDF